VNSATNHYSTSFIVPGKEGSVLKIISGNDTKLSGLATNAWLTIKSID
jgi:hypothetical protein